MKTAVTPIEELAVLRDVCRIPAAPKRIAVVEIMSAGYRDACTRWRMLPDDGEGFLEPDWRKASTPTQPLPRKQG